VLDFGDSHMDVITHNSTPIVPAALAVGEHVDAAWGEVASAIIAGYEVHDRLLAAVQSGHWYRGFQGHGTFGTCGAAIAAARLRRLDEQQTKHALGVAGCIMPVSASDNVFKAYSAKACIPGQAASCGIAAADLAGAGFDGVPLEGEEPRFHAPLHTLSDGGPDLARVIDRLDTYWYSRRVSFKPYPVGHLIIGPVEIALDWVHAHAFEWKDVEHIDIATYKHAVFRTGKYASPDRVRDPAVHELASRVVLREDPEMSAAYPAKWPVEITVRLRNGKALTHRLDEVKWSPERPPRFEDIADKFRLCATARLGDTRSEQVIAMVAGMAPSDRVQPLLALVSAH
jgi:2-methylcitrate dehydratase PrpD